MFSKNFFKGAVCVISSSCAGSLVGNAVAYRAGDTFRAYTSKGGNFPVWCNCGRYGTFVTIDVKALADTLEDSFMFGKINKSSSNRARDLINEYIGYEWLKGELLFDRYFPSDGKNTRELDEVTLNSLKKMLTGFNEMGLIDLDVLKGMDDTLKLWLKGKVLKKGSAKKDRSRNATRAVMLAK